MAGGCGFNQVVERSVGCVIRVALLRAGACVLAHPWCDVKLCRVCPTWPLLCCPPMACCRCRRC